MYATLLFIGCKEKINIQSCSCMWREKDSGRKQRDKIFFIILLGGLYYFIRLYIKIKIGMWSEL